MSTQFPQLVCLQNSTIIMSEKTCYGVTTRMGTWVVCHAVGDCIHCKTNNQSVESFSEIFRKIVIFIFFFENSENSERYLLPKNLRSTVIIRCWQKCKYIWMYTPFFYFRVESDTRCSLLYFSCKNYLDSLLIFECQWLTTCEPYFVLLKTKQKHNRIRHLLNSIPMNDIKTNQGNPFRYPIISLKMSLHSLHIGRPTYNTSLWLS